VAARRRLLLFLGVAVAASMLAVLVAEARVGRALERRLYDGWLTIRGPLPRPADVVVVAIDVDSEESLGRYPWSRDWHTHLIRNLHRAGARVVAFDATFADAFPAQDTLLRQAIDETGIVLLGVKTEVLPGRHFQRVRLEEPAGVLRDSPVGVVDTWPDPADGVVREYPILHRQGDRSVPQLGVAAALRAMGMTVEEIRETEQGWHLGDRFIPRGPGGGMLINFLGPPGSVATYSYASVVDDADTDIGEWNMDIFEDFLEEGIFRDRVVLVGSTVPEHQDLHPTPFRDAHGREGTAFTAGVEIHAHAVATLMGGDHLRVRHRPTQYAWTLILGLLATLATARAGALWGAPLGLGLAAGALATAYLLLATQGVWLWSLAPVLAVGLAYGGTNAALFLTEEREKARIRGMFQQYVAASVVDELIRKPELLALGGEERVLTVLFSDVVGFSTIAEKLTPARLVELLNEYFTVMTEVILVHGGIVDKYQGDALMAEFGAPVPLEDHALRACRAALAMNRALDRMAPEWEAAGKPRLDTRVGINTGKMLLGNLGSRRIMDYTVMGDAVNLGSRLEGANRAYGTRILVSEYTWAEVRDRVIGRELDWIRVKGKTEPVRIYEVVAEVGDPIAPETEHRLEEFARAYALYQDRDFAAALRAFSAIAERHPEDGPTRLYVTRCRDLLDRPAPADWDGVFTRTTK
jgi:adenylate cyclase